MKESIEKVKETTESLAAKEEKLDDEINDTCDQLVIIIIIIFTRPRPAFGRLGLGGWSGGYSSHG